MIKSKLKTVDNLSETKSKQLERLAVKLIKFMQNNDIKRYSFCYISNDVQEDKRMNADYTDTMVCDSKDNVLYDVAVWG